MTNWTVKDLEYWDDRIRELVAEIGLDCYPQEFEICDQNSMLGYMAYHGMPSHYPHWSFGKAYEQTKTMSGREERRERMMAENSTVLGG